MKKNKFVILGLYTLLAVVLILLDQLTKHLTELYLSPLGTSHVFIPGVVAFTSVHNTGAAFSSPQATVARAGQGSRINERILWTSRQKRSITTGSGAL